MRVNLKPTIEFDKKYNTNLAQIWTNYPLQLSDDEIFNIERNNNEKYTEIANMLSYKHFPYKGIENLSTRIKKDILAGMISSFNYDDIVHFSINRVFGYMNGDINNDIILHYDTVKILYDIQWVMSPKTLTKLKKQLVK